MGQNVEYCNDKDAKQTENFNHVNYETCGKKQKYTKEDRCNATEERCHTKYVGAGVGCGQSATAAAAVTATATGGADRHRKGSAAGGSAGRRGGGARSANKSSGSGSSLAQRLSRCYEIKRAERRVDCGQEPHWQHGKYVRDECGSGIVPNPRDFEPNRKIWCQTPLSMYQATYGELANEFNQLGYSFF